MKQIWIVLVGILGILIIVLLVFGRGGEAPKRIDITDPQYSNAVLSWTVDGPVVAKENHNAIQITVSSTGRTLRIIEGYENQPVQIKHFDNSQAAYDAFTQALRTAGFTRQNGNSTKTNFYSVCPQGNRFIYQIQNNNAEAYLTWTTSCGKGGATFSGNRDLVQQLFQDQIPKYSDLVDDVQLGSSGSSGGLLL